MTATERARWDARPAYLEADRQQLSDERAELRRKVAVMEGEAFAEAYVILKQGREIALLLARVEALEAHVKSIQAVH